VRPIGFGRRGNRVANTRCGGLSKGGVPSKSKPWERSKAQITMRCEKPSMSVSPSSNSGKMRRMPSASCFALRPFGMTAFSLYGLSTNPIACGVNIRPCASTSILSASASRANVSGICCAVLALRPGLTNHLDKHRTSVLRSSHLVEEIDASTLDPISRLQPQGKAEAID
jgi:hypothetical protein